MKNIKLLLLFVFVYACSTDVPISKKYVSERVIIIVVDGPRYQETWDKANQVLIPYRKNMAKDGVLFSNFSNSGITYTNCGHTSITTGVNQNIDNAGNQLPNQPSIFQYYQKEKKVPASKCQIITSKDKLSVLSNCVNIAWRNTYMPEYDCGVSGPHSGYRSDEETFQVALRVLSQKKPNLALIQFKEPDNSGHSGDWDAYIRGIQTSDYYVGMLYKYLQQDTYYAGKTTIIITNDHGRHNDGVADGFINHGDNCSGCRKIEMLAIGPDIKRNQVITNAYNQTDISATVGEILGFKTPYSQGKVILELFK